MRSFVLYYKQLSLYIYLMNIVFLKIKEHLWVRLME
jgi:hypothetical protein